MNKECGSCEYNRQCFIKKNVGIYKCEKITDMNEGIKEILDKLKDSVDNPIDTEVDQFTEEAYDTPNYFCLDPTTNECRILFDYITNLQKRVEQLENIIKEAREWIEHNQYYFPRPYDLLNILNKERG